jgi:hypothetical protein
MYAILLPVPSKQPSCSLAAEIVAIILLVASCEISRLTMFGCGTFRGLNLTVKDKRQLSGISAGRRLGLHPSPRVDPPVVDVGSIVGGKHSSL